VLAASVLAACAQRATEAEPYARWADPLALMPRGAAHTAVVCEGPGSDPVRDVFCAEEPAAITGLVDLQAALAIDRSVLNGVRGLSITGHSTALAMRSVSSINPRMIAVRLEAEPYEMLAFAFARGEQFCELAVRDRNDHELRFYLVGFRQACNEAERGCTPGDLLTPAVESDWTEVTLYDEQDLKNTVLDCGPCHQPDGPGSAKLLRMQELEDPWTHWFWKSSQGGRALLADYYAAKGDETLAGMPVTLLDNSHPGNLSMLAIFAGSQQPNMFDSGAIEEEVRASAAAQPEDNSTPGQSAVWRAVYARAQRGEAIAVPYHDVKVTDPDKLARMTEAYQAYRRGELPRDELPDLRDVFPDDPQRLAEMGMTTEPGLAGEAVLLQACSQCHNPRLDQALSRARFRADLHGMSRAEKDAAIERLQLPEEDPRAMPPPLLRTLGDEARRRAIEALRH
jgi:hypothetical protein